MALPVLCVVSMSVPLEAHPSHRVKWLEMKVSPDRIVVLMRYEISKPRFTADLRERFDSDQNRELSSEEKTSLLRYATVLATEGTELFWDGRRLEPHIEIDRSSGLDRRLPSAYPLNVYLRLEYRVPMPDAEHELRLSDTESRWNSNFACRVLLDSGVVQLDTDVDSDGQSGRIFEFYEGRGSFTMRLRIAR